MKHKALKPEAGCLAQAPRRCGHSSHSCRISVNYSPWLLPKCLTSSIVPSLKQCVVSKPQNDSEQGPSRLPMAQWSRGGRVTAATGTSGRHWGLSGTAWGLAGRFNSILLPNVAHRTSEGDGV